MRKLWLNVLLVIAAIAAVYFLNSRYPLQHWLQLIATSHGPIGILLFSLVYGIGGMLFMPSVPITIAAGVLFGFAAGIPAVLIGSTLGASGGFLTSRYFMRGKLLRRLKDSSRFGAIDKAIAKEGWKIVGLLRMCPLPFGLSNYLYGLTGVSFGHYLVATWAGMLPGHLMFVYVGAAGKHLARSASQGGRPGLPQIALLVLSIAAILAVAVVLKRIVQKALRNAAGEEVAGELARKPEEDADPS